MLSIKRAGSEVASALALAGLALRAVGACRGLIYLTVLMTWIREYLEEVVAEMQKVNWPSRDELIGSTLITIVATFIISGFIFLADEVISRVLQFIYQL